MLNRFLGKQGQDEDRDAPANPEGAPTGLPRLLSVSDLSEATGLQEWRIYELVASKEIPHKRIGRRIMFVAAAVARWLEGESAAAE